MIDKEKIPAEMTKANEKLLVVSRFLANVDLSKTNESTAFAVNQALNNIANAKIVLDQADLILQNIRT